ncbi:MULTISPECIES: Na/Pi cotransporter family protein [Paraburkholderia]|uniref:Na/Pi cotransporter family protein n=1 Tax=Paraburkholderia madseniana TaxID=2599607 RepID=A0AAP5EYD1_9BURK|nr:MULTISPECIES: Na/Pi cotransporter family protein [Paraburkholderia]MCX4150042.1 Na/Pi cotransporter family protein [Paraburkholderia madseniana]MDN7152978.1 Na/Pi cotransporter family protein [Paraburkholderia sp. WS6]MDQ6411860.1 Na/Pi cotransporter family protein [Paraburkholderia madseniana]
MTLTFTLIDLAGSVALLLWGTHMVQTGIQRAFGATLRSLLGRALRGRLGAFLAGIGVTAVLQSSTATGLMTAGFAAGGLVDLVPALAVMLGANVGTTLIVQVLSFDVAAASPAVILVGVLMFRKASNTRAHDLGRVLIGLGLMLLALHQLLGLMTDYEDAPSLRMLLGAASTVPLVDVLLAAGLTWAAHSSVAIILLIMSLCAQNVVPPDAAFALVLGANLGTAINPLLEGATAGDPASKRLPVGNLLSRAVGVGMALAALGPLGRLMVTIEPDNARVVADFHTMFNLVLACLFLPVLSPYARLLGRLLPQRADPADPSRPLYLDPAARQIPMVALGNAAREALRLADVLGEMLAGARAALVEGDRKLIVETRRRDDILDNLNTAIKTYLTSLDPEQLAENDHRRLHEILTFVINIEQAGDVVDLNLLPHATKRVKRGLAFSKEGETELLAMMDRLMTNLRTAASLFMTEDPRTARMLADEKVAFREAESTATASHFERLRSGRIDTAQTSALHLDLLRDLKLINSHIVAAAAYPVLERTGALLPSRIAANEM